MANILPVSADTFRTSASWSKVVTAGLSLRKSLPCFMARMPNGARSRGMGAPAISLSDGSSRISSSLFASLAFGIHLLKIGDRLGEVGVERDQLSAAADHGRGHPHDVIVIQADHAKLDGVFRLCARVGTCSGNLLHHVSARGMQAEGGGHAHGAHDLQKRTAIYILILHLSRSPCPAPLSRSSVRLLMISCGIILLNPHPGVNIGFQPVRSRR